METLFPLYSTDDEDKPKYQLLITLMSWMF